MKKRTQPVVCACHAQVQRAESKRLRIEARLRPACWDLQQEFAADWKAMPAMAEDVQAFLVHAVALPYGSSVSLPPYWPVDTGDDEPHRDDGTGDTSIPAHDWNVVAARPELPVTACEIGAALDASAAKLATAARVKRSLLLGARMWADTNYDALDAALRPRRPPSKDDYIPPGRGAWRYDGLHGAGEDQHTGTLSTFTPPCTEMWGPPLLDAPFGHHGCGGCGGGSAHRSCLWPDNPCSEAVLQQLPCGARPPLLRDAPPHLHAPQPYDPRHAPSSRYPGPYGTPPHAPPPCLPPTFDGLPQPPPLHPHPHPRPHQHAQLRLFQVPFVPHPHPASHPQAHPSGHPPSHLHCSLHLAPPHHTPPHVEWSARSTSSEQPQPQPQLPLLPSASQQPKVDGSSSSTGTAAVPPVGWGGRGAGGRDDGCGCDCWEGGDRLQRWEQRGDGRSRSRSSSPSPEGHSLRRRRRSSPSRSHSHSHSRGGWRSPYRRWGSDRSPIGRDGGDRGRDRGRERRGREYRRV